MAKNLPCNAGAKSPIPASGTEIQHVTQQLSPRATTTELRHNWGPHAPVKDPSQNNDGATGKAQRSQEIHV